MKYGYYKTIDNRKNVAPLAGAWIEIYLSRTFAINSSSLPSRERGLKSFMSTSLLDSQYVAPLAGAWIEIPIRWLTALDVLVAPLAGAWIEIFASVVNEIKDLSLPSRERGLK